MRARDDQARSSARMLALSSARGASSSFLISWNCARRFRRQLTRTGGRT